MLNSIRGRLTCGVTLAALGMILISGWIIYQKTKCNTLAQIDRALIEHAYLLSRQVEFEDDETALEHGEWLPTLCKCQTLFRTPMKDDTQG